MAIKNDASSRNGNVTVHRDTNEVHSFHPQTFQYLDIKEKQPNGSITETKLTEGGALTDPELLSVNGVDVKALSPVELARAQALEAKAHKLLGDVTAVAPVDANTPPASGPATGSAPRSRNAKSM